MNDFKKHLIHQNESVKAAMIKLDKLATDAILFLVDDHDKLIGSLTDGDLRRGFINDRTLQDSLLSFIQAHPKFIYENEYSLSQLTELREKNYKVFPVLNKEHQVIDVINFRVLKSFIPADAVLMAGGRGERLRPLTDTLPKPMLPVGDKPIIEHNIDRLCKFGMFDVWITLKYMGQKIKDHFGDGSQRSMHIHYVEEQDALGTAGALRLIPSFEHDSVLLMNSDLMTNINYEDFFLFFQKEQADLAVACIPYSVNIPYAVMETTGLEVTGFKEKPSYTHYSNAGIYFMKREVIDLIPKNQFYNATDLMDALIAAGKKVVAYPMVEYWLDIGRHDDYKKAQEDIKLINL
jgi:dTDP-glucose pyrophosphorylase